MTTQPNNTNPTTTDRQIFTQPQQAPRGELATIAQTAETLDRLTTSGVAIMRQDGNFTKALQLADVMRQMQDTLTPENMRAVMALQGNLLGFRTDKDDKGGYPPNVVRDCLIASVLLGLTPCGNQFNIIAGRPYVTKEGFTHLLRSIPRLEYSLAVDVPRMANNGGGAVCSCVITYRVGDGEKKTETIERAVRMNAGMGADAIVGKMERKALKHLYTVITGQAIEDGDTADAAADTMRNVTPEGPQRGRIGSN